MKMIKLCFANGKWGNQTATNVMETNFGTNGSKTRKSSILIGITAIRICHALKAHKFHPYEIKLVQKLKKVK